MKTVLAAVDFSNICDAVVAEAEKLARSIKGRIVLVSVVQPIVITSEYAPLMENMAAITEAGDRAAQQRLERLLKQIQSRRISCTAVCLDGAPVPHILEQAATHDADYIVMGSHGHTAFYDLLVGSTTHGVMLRAKCPVVIVPPEQKQPRDAGRNRHAARRQPPSRVSAGRLAGR